MIRGTKGVAVAWIRASCPTCGDVELRIGDVEVKMCSSTGEGSYVFRCPSCLLAVSKPAEPNVVEVLVASGVRLSTWQLPAELDEPHYGPPISYDELLEFHFDLRGDEWVRELVHLGDPGGHHLEPAAPQDQS